MCSYIEDVSIMDNYIISKSEDSSEWHLTGAEKETFDTYGNSMVIVAKLYNVSWQTAKAIKETLMIEGQHG
jgi:hypothetical protein